MFENTVTRDLDEWIDVLEFVHVVRYEETIRFASKGSKVCFCIAEALLSCLSSFWSPENIFHDLKKPLVFSNIQYGIPPGRRGCCSSEVLLTMPQKKIYPPGYGGFVPGIAAGNMHGMTFGSILSKDNLRIANKRAQLSAERCNPLSAVSLAQFHMRLF